MIENPTRPVLATCRPAEVVKNEPVHLDAFVYITAIAASGLICASVWPGFMSFDSLETLRQARFGVTTNGYPTIVVYFQRICDALLPGPGLLFSLQIILYLGSCAAILTRLRIPTIASCATILFLAFSPALLGPLLVVWKDIGMTAFLCLAVACVLQLNRHGKSIAMLSLAIAALFVATAYRLNGITATAPILFWCMFTYCNRNTVRAFYLTCLVLPLICVGVLGLNKFRLPDFKPLDSHIEAILYTFDLVGVSARSGENVVPPVFTEAYPQFTMPDVRSIYFPEHGGRSWVADANEPSKKILSATVITALQSGGTFTARNGSQYSVSDLKKDWWRAIVKHPRSYLKHRYDAARAFLGIGASQPWGLTHPLVLDNDLGVRHVPGMFTKPMLAWLNFSQTWPTAFPGFYYLCGCGTAGVLAIRWRGLHNSEICLALLVSAFGLLAPMILITASSEQRYHMWSIVAVIIAFVSVAGSFCSAHLPKSAQNEVV